MTGLRLVCVLGPPAAGKTTLATRLAAELGVLVLRPRDVIRETVTRCPAVDGLFETDAAGRVADESLGLALRSTVERKNVTVILENLPWTAAQLCDLVRLAPAQLMILHLQATDALVIERRRARRHCQTCYPQPALITDAGTCERCGSLLTRRDDDETTAFAERLGLHHQLVGRILELAPRLHVPVVPLDATHDVDRLARQAQHSVEQAGNPYDVSQPCRRPTAA